MWGDPQSGRIGQAQAARRILAKAAQPMIRAVFRRKQGRSLPWFQKPLCAVQRRNQRGCCTRKNAIPAATLHQRSVAGIDLDQPTNRHPRVARLGGNLPFACRSSCSDQCSGGGNWPAAPVQEQSSFELQPLRTEVDLGKLVPAPHAYSLASPLSLTSPGIATGTAAKANLTPQRRQGERPALSFGQFPA
jgi:hypothetical protein